MKILVKVFAKINSPENKHLKLFYLIVPTLALNYVESVSIAKEKLIKKNSIDAYISVIIFI